MFKPGSAAQNLLVGGIFDAGPFGGWSMPHIMQEHLRKGCCFSVMTIPRNALFQNSRAASAVLARPCGAKTKVSGHKADMVWVGRPGRANLPKLTSRLLYGCISLPIPAVQPTYTHSAISNHAPGRRPFMSHPPIPPLAPQPAPVLKQPASHPPIPPPTKKTH